MNTAPLTDQEQKTLQYYNQTGHAWIEEQKVPSFWIQEIETFASLLPFGTILEVGAGAGKEASLLCQKGYDYIGTDISPTMIKYALTLNPGATILHLSLYDLTVFRSNTFDGFWAAAVFLHVPKERLDEAFTPLKNVLKPGAIGCITLKKGAGEEIDQTGRFFSYFTHDEFAARLEKHDFIIELSYERSGIKQITTYTWLVFFVKYMPPMV